MAQEKHAALEKIGISTCILYFVEKYQKTKFNLKIIFVKTLKAHGRRQLFLTESIDNTELDNKNKEILSNNFDRTKDKIGRKK
jgi:hypothetical protein